MAQPKDAWFEHIENPSGLLLELAQAKTGADIFTFWQTLPETQPLYDYYFEWDNIAAIPIQSYDYWFKKQVVQNARNKIRKALKLGVIVEEVPFDDAFCMSLTKIYNETPIRQGRKFIHYGIDVEALKDGLSDKLESAVFLGAFYEGELVGYIKLLLLRKFIRATGTLTSTRHRDKPIMNLLICKAVEYCALHTFPFLAYGRFTYGKKGDDGLTEFKRHNGFEKIDIPRYYIPITLTGKLALRLKLHREMSSLLPTNLYQFFLSLRSRWYTKSKAAFYSSK
ncbi:MAG: hypothetical protein A4E69_00382 [Syntrophus sp. PtaB.Bin138]|nr:MAG: hypothetical protein A4E69_00382 [Syntrophus sp. PtaB.Bin138]